MTGRVRPGVQQVCSLCALLHGLALAMSPEAYSPVSYRHHFDLMPARLWGAVFLAVGAFALGAVAAPTWQRQQALQTHLAQWSVALQATVLALWAWLLIVAAADTSLTVTYSAPIPWGCVAVTSFVSLWRFGTGR